MLKKTIIGVIVLILILSSVYFYFHTQNEEEHEKVSGMFNVLKFWNLSRAYPEKTIPDAAHYRAYQFSKQALKKQLAANDEVPPWKALGPHNMGGRTLAVVFNPLNPNTIYAGAASGGLWRSCSGGVGASAWEYIPTGYPVLGVSTIAIAPDDSNTIYIGTGEVYNYQDAGTGAAVRITRGTYGIGILKSTDGGKSWAPSLDWSYNQQHGIWMIKINPLNPKTIWAATTEGVYKSLDAGANWQKVHEVIMATDLVIHPVDTNTVIVACGNFYSDGHGIYRTTDGGATWNRAKGDLPAVFGGKALLAIAPSSPNVVYASIGNSYGEDNATWLCMSMDSGENWYIVSQEDYSQYQGWFAHDVAVDPTSHLNLITVGIDIWKSESAGMRLKQKSVWYNYYVAPTPPGAPEGTTNYSHADHHDVQYHPTDPNIVYFATDGGIFRSINGGETFEGCNGGYQTVQFYNGFSCSQQDSNLAMGGLQDNATVIYRGTSAWDKWVVGGDGCWTAISARNDNVMYGSSQYLRVLKSTNKGKNWSGVGIPDLGETVFVAPFILGIDNPDVMYAGMTVITRSTDAGQSWAETNNGAPLDGNPPLVMAISHQNSDVLYVGTAPIYNPLGVFRTTDGGATWKNITASLPERFPGDLCVDPNNDLNVYIALMGFGSSHVFKSKDGGDTWEDIGLGLPDVPASAVIVDPDYPEHIYIGNDLGVYVSRDDGYTWMEFIDGLPDAVIAMDLQISPTNRMLRVATHGNGAYERKLLEPLPAKVAQPPAVQQTFKLDQNFPNPFNASTRISYSLAEPSVVRVRIINSLGQLVKVLVDNEHQAEGRHQIIWDGTDANGNYVAAGTYIYQLQTNKFSKSRQMSFIK